MPYSSNLPPEIQEKVERLTECQKQITGLESQLIQFKKEKDRLEEELLDYHVDKTPERPVSAVMVAVGRTNIQKLPDEMLLHILEYFLSKNHRLIRRLLLVGNHWNRMVMQSPRLWARIQLSPLDYEEYRYSSASLLRYVEVCIQRSKSVPLDIELDYEYLRTREEYVQERILRTVYDITDSSSLADQVSNLDFVSPEYDAYFEQTTNELSTLIGPMGAHMERWRSLYLCLPVYDYSLALNILEMMRRAAPNLESVSLSQIEYILDMNDHGWFDEDETPLLSIPSLRSLKLDDAEAALLLKDIVMTPSALVHLDIISDADLRALYQLQGFTTLRTLKLRIRGYFGLPPVPGTEKLPIPLRELRELNLEGDLRPLKAFQFDLPNLQCLRISDGGNSEFQLPANLSPEYIHWSSDGYQTLNIIQSTIKAILQCCSRVTVFKVFRDNYESVLEEIHKASDLPVSLETITVDLVGVERVHIDVATLRP
ncbi:hypothetical protein M408DRAFT_255710 [Serendipita vermifera MAFF 305830]|uniref:F-box domain-containing protein n=1 Tax=Serendipita vermifera MAFF 305830 TaxID=933852 RepID=A0A0C3BGE5_SERVB|nr:hypothetical protein M408DRAFT_255710 [Serendipita vermifera MAFF 305830]